MKKRFFFLILAFYSSLLHAQVSGKINGEIKTAGNESVEGSIISLLRAKDSVLVKTVLSDSAGMFGFSMIKNDTYVLTVSHISYDKYISPAIKVDEEHDRISLPVIVLQPSSAQQLANVTVAAKTRFIEKRIDRTVVNPDALIGNAGTTALDVLEKSPGVQVDINGGISLKGKAGVLIYIDDKPTYLSSADLANYLRSLPAGALGSIEIMTTPPAKYDAAGNAGIINIKLKRTKTMGFNGGFSAGYGQGTYARSNNSFNFNYRINKLNFFSNISYGINNSYQDLYINRTYYKTDGSLNSAFNQNSYIKRQASGANAKFGMDYYVDKKSTIGIVLTGFSNLTKNTTTNVAHSYDANMLLQNITTALSPSKRKFRNGSVSLNYVNKIGNAGKEISFNADYVDYTSSTEQFLLSKTYLPSGNLIAVSNLVSDLPAEIIIKSAKADYLAPLKKGGKFEAGVKTSFIDTRNIANFFDEIGTGLFSNYDFSNNFNYKENINAAYLNYGRERKRFSFQLGLRFENTSIKGQQMGNPVHKDSSFTRSYNSLFPTFYAAFNLDTVGKNQLSFSYGRRIDRPNYQDMNPFTYPLDRFTLYSGNPFLKPTFSNNYELSHTYKNMITTTLQYSYTKDVITETIEQSTNTFYSRPGNIGKQTSYGISINAGIPIKKWWMLQLYTEVMTNIYKATLYNQLLNNKGTYWYFGPTNQFVISKTWSAELAGTYQTSVVSGQFITIPVWTARAGVSKKLLRDKATVKFSLSDIFYSNQPGGDIKAIANSNASWKSYLDSRVGTLSFSYRFSKGKGPAARKTGASDTEKSRVR